MTDYSYSQLETLWLDTAKGTQYATNAWAELMAAIAMAESDGDSTAENPSGATGLWQILGAVNPADQNNLTNPTVNAHEALLKLQSQGLGAWVTYTTGAYKKYLTSGVDPSTLPTSGGSDSNTTSSLGIGGFLWPGDITGFFKDAKSFLDALLWIVNPASWLRIGAFGIGLLLLGFGAYALIKVGSDGPIVSMPNVVPVPV
jgi:hypothetical protein